LLARRGGVGDEESGAQVELCVRSASRLWSVVMETWFGVTRLHESDQPDKAGEAQRKQTRLHQVARLSVSWFQNGKGLLRQSL
jgi:hypothetical protein